MSPVRHPSSSLSCCAAAALETEPVAAVFVAAGDRRSRRWLGRFQVGHGTKRKEVRVGHFMDEAEVRSCRSLPVVCRPLALVNHDGVACALSWLLAVLLALKRSVRRGLRLAGGAGGGGGAEEAREARVCADRRHKAHPPPLT